EHLPFIPWQGEWTRRMRPTTTRETSDGRDRRRTTFLSRGVWVYVVLLATATALLWTTGDRWWVGTALCFGPRWVLLVPMPVVGVLAVFNWRSRLAPLVIATILAPIWMDFNIPLPVGDAPAGRAFRIISFNADGENADRSAFAEWALAQNPDVVVFEE